MAPPIAVSALHALLRLLTVLGSALGAFGQLQGHFMPLQEARRSPHGPSVCASQLLQACCWALGVVVVEQGGQGVGESFLIKLTRFAC
jgi:hypothetical protein